MKRAKFTAGLLALVLVLSLAAPVFGADADEAWDELEKSIVANLADEVTVNIVGNAVKIVITKTF